MPPVCLTFLAQGIANEDRFEEDEHKEIRVKARELKVGVAVERLGGLAQCKGQHALT